MINWIVRQKCNIASGWLSFQFPTDYFCNRMGLLRLSLYIANIFATAYRIVRQNVYTFQWASILIHKGNPWWVYLSTDTERSSGWLTWVVTEHAEAWLQHFPFRPGQSSWQPFHFSVYCKMILWCNRGLYSSKYMYWKYTQKLVRKGKVRGINGESDLCLTFTDDIWKLWAVLLWYWDRNKMDAIF